MRRALCVLWLSSSLTLLPLAGHAESSAPVDVSTLRTQALSSEMSPRRKALKALVALGTAEAAEALLAAALAAEKRGDRIGVADVSFTLKSVTAPEMAPPLREALRRGEPRALRPALATTLGRLGDRESAPILRALSRSDDRGLARTAYVALGGATRDPADVERFVQDLYARQTESAAVDAIDELRTPSLAPSLYPVLRDPRAPYAGVLAVIQALGRMAEPSSAVPLLDVVERDERSTMRRAAANALVSVAEPEHVPRMERMLKEGAGSVDEAFLVADRRQRWRAMKRLITKKHPRVATLLYKVASDAHASDEPLALAALASKDPSIRRAGVDILGALDSKSAETRLCRELKDTRNVFTVRVDAARALGKHGSDDAIVCLIEAMEGEQRSPKQHRRRYHGNLTWEECVKALRRITGEKLDEDPKAWRTWHKGGLRAGVDGMIVGLSHDDAAVRALAAKRLLEHRDAKARAKALDALLAAVAKERSGDARTQMVKAIGAIRDPKARDVLVTVLEAKHSRTLEEHVALARALDDLGDGRGTASLIELLGSAKPDERALAARALSEVTGEPLHYDAARWRAWWRLYAERYRGAAPRAP